MHSTRLESANDVPQSRMMSALQTSPMSRCYQTFMDTGWATERTRR